MDPASGDQPLFNEDRTISVTVNGEIYNYKELMAKILEKKPGLKFATQSDCEVGPVAHNSSAFMGELHGRHDDTLPVCPSCPQVISHLYELFGNDVASMLDGFFAFVILDKNTNTFYAARDPIGITCMYIGWGRDGSVWLSSEMKCLKVGPGMN